MWDPPIDLTLEEDEYPAPKQEHILQYVPTLLRPIATPATCGLPALMKQQEVDEQSIAVKQSYENSLDASHRRVPCPENRDVPRTDKKTRRVRERHDSDEQMWLGLVPDAFAVRSKLPSSPIAKCSSPIAKRALFPSPVFRRSHLSH